MSKLVEVKMPPLDGTKFIVMWIGKMNTPCSEMCRVRDGVINRYSDDKSDYIHNPCVVKYGWENDLDARYFVAED